MTTPQLQLTISPTTLVHLQDPAILAAITALGACFSVVPLASISFLQRAYVGTDDIHDITVVTADGRIWGEVISLNDDLLDPRISIDNDGEGSQEGLFTWTAPEQSAIQAATA